VDEYKLSEVHDKPSEKHLSESDKVGLAHKLCTFKIITKFYVSDNRFFFFLERVIFKLFILTRKREISRCKLLLA